MHVCMYEINKTGTCSQKKTNKQRYKESKTSHGTLKLIKNNKINVTTGQIHKQRLLISWSDGLLK